MKTKCNYADAWLLKGTNAGKATPKHVGEGKDCHPEYLEKRREVWKHDAHGSDPNDRSPALLILPCLVISTLVLQFGIIRP